MGKAYVEELLPDRHAILMQMQGYVASSDPEIQAHVRAALGRRSWPRWRGCPAPRPRRCGTSSPTGCCSTSRRRSTSGRSPGRAVGGRVVAGGPDAPGTTTPRLLMLDRLARFRRPPPRGRAGRRGAGRVAAGAFGGPVVGLLDTGDDFTTRRRSRSSRATRSRGSTGHSAAPDALVLVRLGATAGTPRGAAQAATRRAGLVEDRTSPRCGALRGRRARAAGLAGPALDLRGGDVPPRRRTRTRRPTRWSARSAASRA